ncbi:MAG: hypothetical protein LBF83_02005 [Spirochaetaceae bacterium]|nr:hypothetical protein [Spirochaetaceae bacterium]
MIVAKIYTMGELIVEIMRIENDRPLNKTALFKGPFPSGAPAIFISTAARLAAVSRASGAAHTRVEGAPAGGLDCFAPQQRLEFAVSNPPCGG